MKKYIDIPPIWFVLCAFAAWFLARIWPVYQVDLNRWFIGVVVGTGVYLIVWSALWFWRKKTPIEPRHTPNSLLVEGPFKVNRNPIYTGFTIILLGIVLWIGAFTALFPVLAFPFIITSRFIKGEESQIREQFGDEAEVYFSRTRRW